MIRQQASRCMMHGLCSDRPEHPIDERLSKAGLTLPAMASSPVSMHRTSMSGIAPPRYMAVVVCGCRLILTGLMKIMQGTVQ